MIQFSSTYCNVYAMCKLRFRICNLHNSTVNCTKLGVQVATYTEFDSEIISTCTTPFNENNIRKNSFLGINNYNMVLYIY